MDILNYIGLAIALWAIGVVIFLRWWHNVQKKSHWAADVTDKYLEDKKATQSKIEPKIQHYHRTKGKRP